jgi:hypothetical protein
LTANQSVGPASSPQRVTYGHDDAPGSLLGNRQCSQYFVLPDIIKFPVAKCAMAEKLLIVDDEVGLTKVVGLIARKLGLEFKALNKSSNALEVFLSCSST